MDYLIRFSERPDVRAIITTAMNYESVQGVVLEIDPIWLSAWRLREQYGSRVSDLMMRNMMRRFPTYGSMYPEPSSGSYWIPSKPLDPQSLRWHPPYWKEYLSLNGWETSEGEPITIKICLLPATPGRERQIPTFENSHLPIIFETRTPAKLLINTQASFRPVLGGVSIGIGNQGAGTLGGILENASGERYGLTCGHVLAHQINPVDQPAKCDGGRLNSIGFVTYSSQLITCAKNAPCSRWATDTPFNIVDAALIQLDPKISSKLEVLEIGKITGLVPRSQLSQGQMVEFTGRSSGHKILELGGLAVAYRISDADGVWYCFTDLLQIRSSSFLQAVFGRPVKAGDSGSWICAPSEQDYNWCGMVIGGDRFIGYAVASESIKDWWESHHLKLNLV